MPIGNIENSATFGISGIWSVPNRGNRSRLAPDFGIDGIHPVLFDPPHTGSYNRTVLAALSLPAGFRAGWSRFKVAHSTMSAFSERMQGHWFGR